MEWCRSTHINMFENTFDWLYKNKSFNCLLLYEILFSTKKKSLYCLVVFNVEKSKAFVVFVSLYVTSFRGSSLYFWHSGTSWNFQILYFRSIFIHCTCFSGGSLSLNIYSFIFGKICRGTEFFLSTFLPLTFLFFSYSIIIGPKYEQFFIFLFIFSPKKFPLLYLSS